MARAGLRVGLVHLPLTWPPDSSLAFVVPGHGPREGMQTHPPELHGDLERQFPGYDRSAKGRSAGALVKAMEEAQERRDQAALWVAREMPWDVLMVMVKATDSVAHATWRFRDPDHPAHRKGDEELAGALDRSYVSADSLIGDLRALAPDANIVVASDHGHGPCHHSLGINQWLLDAGFLHLKPRYAAVGRSRLLYGLARARHRSGWDLFRAMVDWSSTLAYGGTGTEQGIYVNTVGREPEGVVRPGEDRERLLDAISEGLEALVPPGSGQSLGPCVVARQEDHVYGPHAFEAPDLFFVGAEGRVILREGLRPGPLFRTASRSSGTHRSDGLLTMAGPLVDSGANIADARIWDLAPTLLTMAGIPVPGGLDGQVLDPIQAEPQMSKEMGTAFDEPPSLSNPVSRAEERRVRRELEGLGYIEG